MLERLGNVLYWLGNGLAALCLGAGVVIALTHSDIQPLVALSILGAMIWFVGRATKYVFTGR